jgi:hypothetical protein
MFGDYDLLCTLYGISGASGRHCCLWCSITSDQLKIPRDMRQNTSITTRSLDSLTQCYSEFISKSDGNLKKAKLHNNVINKFFFNIPLSQVCPPGLHITLGIFQRLFNLLEEECHMLDLQVVNPSYACSSNSFEMYITTKSATQKRS